MSIQGSRTETQVHHSDVPENRYSVQVFLESEGERVFSWKFAVGKDLNALKSVSLTYHTCMMNNKFMLVSILL